MVHPRRTRRAVALALGVVLACSVALTVGHDGRSLAWVPVAGSTPAMAEGPRAPAPAAAPVDGDPTVPGLPPRPAGMARHPGGAVTIGIDEKDLKAWVDATSVGRMEKSFVETAWAAELSPWTPAHEVQLAPYWLALYETTNAQYHRFLHEAGAVEHVVPQAGQPGARTLLELSRAHLLAPPYQTREGTYFPVAVEWKTLYDINVATLDPDGSIGAAPFKDRPLPPGTRLRTFRYSLPETWFDSKKSFRRMVDFPAGQDDYPVTGVSLIDAMACAAYYGNHVPTEHQWEAGARGPKGAPFPEGDRFDPLAHAWKDFNLELARAQERARKRLAVLADAPDTEKKQAEVQRLEALMARRPLAEDALSVPVGLFPDGRSSLGVFDMLGNVDEWVSTALTKYPGSSTNSVYIAMNARVLRGGNLLDKDTLLHAAARKFVSSGPIAPHFRFTSSGFRMAREDVPGLSMALPAIDRAIQSVPCVLPGESDPKTYIAQFVGIATAHAVGIEQVHETAPGVDPPGKVFHLGPARGLSLSPASGTPFNDTGRLNKAADGAAAPPPPAPGARPVKDPRRPRDIPFLGFLHATPDIGFKGLKKVVTVRVEPIPGARPVPKVVAEEEGSTEDPPAEGGEGTPPKEGEKPKDGGKPAEGGGTKPEPEMVIPTRQVEVITHEAGTLSAAAFPDGFLVGYGNFNGARRVALWGARQSTYGSDAPGGIVLLEPPDLLLDPRGVKFERVSAPRAGEVRRLDSVSGELEMTFFLAHEGKGQKGGWMVTVILTLDFEPGDRPWVLTPRPR